MHPIVSRLCHLCAAIRILRPPGIQAFFARPLPDSNLDSIKMEEVDLENTVYVPDTPDRAFSNKSKAMEHTEKKNNVFSEGHSRNSDSRHQFLNQMESRRDLTKQGGCNKQLKFKIPRTIRADNQEKGDKSVIDLCSSPSSSHSQHTLKFRRSILGKPVQEKSEGSARQIQPSSVASNGADQYSKRSSCHQLWPKEFLPHNDLLNDATGEKKREVSFSSAGCSSDYRSTARTCGYSSKGKEKTVENSRVPHEADVPHVDKGWNMNSNASASRAAISVAHNAQESMSKSLHQIESPERRPIRFVRNGLISPHNIAKGKMIAGENIRLRDSEQNNDGSSVCVEPSAPIDISDSSAERNACATSKGNGVKSHLRMSQEADIDAQHLYNRNMVIPAEDYNINREANEEVGNWRRTHSHPQNIGPSLSNSRINNNVGLGVMQNGKKTVCGTSSQNARYAQGGEHHRKAISDRSLNGHAHAVSQRTSYAASESGRVTKRHCQADSSTIQQRTNEGLPRRLISEPSSSRRNDSGRSNSNNMDSRDWQLEADEKLARELQEQLYQEDNLFSGTEMDANIAFSLLQDEQAMASPNGAHPRQSRLRYSQPPSRRRGARSRVTGISRRAQPRAGFRTSSSLNFGGLFPLDMTVDTRLDILEALEAASGNINDLGILDALFEDGDAFDENDYERLLALDENNHERGASTHQINSLPVSTVQTDNFEDNCAICLETPGLGEAIRHLPCFHKFHKEVCQFNIFRTLSQSPIM
uniref:RING-type domain-containing protein n=2 Tax=Kalanchoe fedtschenkoi TaxID=63787 RepID=A0A7N0VF73_KALFE